MSRQAIIDIAAAEKGMGEKPANSNLTKYGKWYGFDGVPWCAMFVSWVYDQAGYPLGKIDDENGFRYCPSAYQFWKAHDRITTEPHKGDIVLFDWSGDGKCDHTGIFVEWVTPYKSFISWEGNTAMGNDSDGGKVMLRSRNTSTVKAFVDAGVIDGSEVIAPENTLEKGSRNAAVSTLQKSLYDLGYEIVVDGIFGPDTEKTVRQFQKEHGFHVNGVVSNEISGAIEAELNSMSIPANKFTSGTYLKKGDMGSAVLALQKALLKYSKLISLKADGVFGNNTLKAVKAFQQDRHFTVDGIAGPVTLNALGLNKK
ncbi:MAG: hypothetical protein RLZZ28_618 [Bacteroidota bacterium]|jgi:peptidoglycan hydrolase-like protein with peptidoglycan-binding domain